MVTKPVLESPTVAANGAVHQANGPVRPTPDPKVGTPEWMRIVDRQSELVRQSEAGTISQEGAEELRRLGDIVGRVLGPNYQGRSLSGGNPLAELKALIRAAEETEANLPQLAATLPPDFPRVGTPEWVMMNERRGELIHRNIYESLTPEEQSELSYLQHYSGIAVQVAFPWRPPITSQQLEELEARLNAKNAGDAGER